MKKLAIIAIVAVAGASNAVVYDNGPVTNGTFNGNPISSFGPPDTNFGQGCQTASLNALADDFTVTGLGWNVSRISLYAYQGGATNFTFTGANVSVVTGNDPNAGVVRLNVVGAAVVNGGFAGYRVPAANQGRIDKPIFRVDLATTNLILLPGTHMLRWSLSGSLANGPFSPPTAPLPANGGNAWQSLGGQPFAPVFDGGSLIQEEFPFQIEYTAVPEPATMLALGAGLAAIASRRRRK